MQTVGCSTGSGDVIRTESSTERARLVQLGITVEWLTIAWMVVEVGVGITAAILAGSVALMAFGLDGGIEIVSAGVMVWRLGIEQQGGNVERVEQAERRASKLVGWSLMLLAIYVVASAAWGLWQRSQPEPTALGIALAAAAAVIMPVLVGVKRHIADSIGSAALRGDAAEGVVCAYMAIVLLAGLVLRAVFGWWWADSIAALGIVYVIVREGREALGEARAEEDDGVVN